MPTKKRSKPLNVGDEQENGYMGDAGSGNGQVCCFSYYKFVFAVSESNKTDGQKTYEIERLVRKVVENVGGVSFIKVCFDFADGRFLTPI